MCCAGWRIIYTEFSHQDRWRSRSLARYPGSSEIIDWYWYSLSRWGIGILLKAMISKTLDTTSSRPIGVKREETLGPIAILRQDSLEIPASPDTHVEETLRRQNALDATQHGRQFPFGLVQQAIHSIDGAERSRLELEIGHVHDMCGQAFLAAERDHLRRQISAGDGHPLLLEELTVTPRAGSEFQQGASIFRMQAIEKRLPFGYLPRRALKAIAVSSLLVI